jgi:hypothetical protein
MLAALIDVPAGIGYPVLLRSSPASRPALSFPARRL